MIGGIFLEFSVNCPKSQKEVNIKQLQVKPLLPPVHMYDNLNIRVCTYYSIHLIIAYTD